MGSFRFAWDHLGAPRIRRVHSWSRGFTPALLGVVWLIRVCMGSRGRAHGLSG